MAERRPALLVALGSSTSQRVLVWVCLGPVLLFLLVPTLIVIPMSLTPKGILEFPPSGLSLHTFRDFFADPQWTSAASTSLIVAAVVVVVALVIGTLAAVALHGATFRGRGILLALIMLPMVIPLIVLALGDFSFLASLGLIGTRLGIALAHSIIAVPYVTIVMLASLAGVNPQLVRSAQSLGAGHGSVFRHVYLPVIRPGLAAGALFAFAVSFDEAVIAYFLQGPDATTLPVKMFVDIQQDLTPTIAAVSTMLLALTTILLAAQIFFMKRRSRISLVPRTQVDDAAS